MFNRRAEKQELMDDLSLNNDELRKNLDELEIYNKWLGSKKSLIHALNIISEKYSQHLSNNKIVIADLCCGGGDLLRAVDQWAKSKNLTVELVGIDANPFMIEYATLKSGNYPNIHYKVINIFSHEFSTMRFDIVCINSSCHHFSDEDLVNLFKGLKEQTKLAIIINDLQRHWFSYYAIKLITKLFNISYLAKHDAPLSVLRAFRKNELANILKLANLQSFRIKWAWAFRWNVIVWLKSCGR